MNDSGRQIGECPHGRTKEECTVCLRQEVSWLNAEVLRLQKQIELLSKKAEKYTQTNIVDIVSLQSRLEEYRTALLESRQMCLEEVKKRLFAEVEIESLKHTLNDMKEKTNAETEVPSQS